MYVLKYFQMIVKELLPGKDNSFLHLNSSPYLKLQVAKNTTTVSCTVEGFQNCLKKSDIFIV